LNARCGRRLEWDGKMATVEIAFLTHWFDQDVRPLWDKHLLPAMTPPITEYLEIGVGEGHSMRWVMENLKPEFAVGIDPYVPKKKREAKQYRQHRKNAIANLEPWIDDNLVLIEEPSQKVLRDNCIQEPTVRRIPDDSCDLIYCDGDHTCLNAMTDFILCWPRLKLGGIMIMDDMLRRWQLGWPWTREAILAFLTVIEKRFEPLWTNPWDMECRQMAIRKVRP